MNRRELIGGALLVPISLSLGGCQSLVSAVGAVPVIASDVQLVATALQTILPTIEALTGLAGGAKNTIVGLIGQVSGIASQVGNAASSGVASLATTLGQVVGELAGQLSGVTGLPSIVNQVVGDVLALVPSILSAAGAKPVAPSATARLIASRASQMNADQARADLQLIVARR